MRFAATSAASGTIEDIDNGMKLGCGYPMGPLTLLDFVGLDTTYYIANIMFDEYKDPMFAAPPLLKRMVLAGKLGRKSGEGFYKVLARAPELRGCADAGSRSAIAGRARRGSRRVRASSRPRVASTSRCGS